MPFVVGVTRVLRCVFEGFWRAKAGVLTAEFLRDRPMFELICEASPEEEEGSRGEEEEGEEGEEGGRV